MAASNPPTENITSFNSSLFNQPQVNLTQSQADLLYLSKTTTDTSTAGNTTFTGTINSTIIKTVNSNTCSIGTNVSAQQRTVNVGTGNNIGNDDVVLGYAAFCAGSFSVAIGRNASTSYQTQCTAIGANSSVPNPYDYSTAIGYSATATASNQVVLGTSSETVIIPNQIRFSKSAYSFPFASNQIQGYYSLNGGSSTSLTTATITNILTSAVPIGVWRIDYTIQMTADTGGTVTNSRSVISATSASLTPTQWGALPYTGSSLRSHVSEVYTAGDIQIINGSFTYNQPTAGNLYLNVLRTFATGTFSCIGSMSITKLA
jgi:hypothetical protein